MTLLQVEKWVPYKFIQYLQYTTNYEADIPDEVSDYSRSCTNAVQR